MEYKKYYWLNDKSREFLTRGYVRDGQTAEQRVREIAEAAEKYLGIEGYADKFEDYMSRGWFSLSSPLWANYGLKEACHVHAMALTLKIRWIQSSLKLVSLEQWTSMALEHLLSLGH
jgi:hypothetical protein